MTTIRRGGGGALGGAAWSTFETGLRQGVGAVAFLLLARWLEPSAFGTVAIALALSVFMHNTFMTSFGHAVVQLKDLEPAHLDSVFWCVLAGGLGFVLLVVLGRDALGALMHDPMLPPILVWVLLGFLLQVSVVVHEGVLQRAMRFRLLAVRSSVSTLAGGAVGVTMAATGYGVWSLVGQQLTLTSTAAAILWLTSGWRPRLRFSVAHLRDLVPFAKFQLARGAVNFLQQRIDVFLLGAVLGPHAVGLYTVARRLVMLLLESTAGAVSRVALAAFARLQGDPAALRGALYDWARNVALLAFPLFLGLAAVAPEFVAALLTERWADAVPVVRVLAVFGLMQSVLFLVYNQLMACGRTDLFFYFTAAGTALTVALMAAAVWFGPLAVAAAFTAVPVLTLPLLFRYAGAVGGVRWRAFGAAVQRPLLAALVMAVAVAALTRLLEPMLAPGWRLGAGVAAGALIYAGLAWLLMGDLVRDALRRLGARRRAGAAAAAGAAGSPAAPPEEPRAAP